MTQVCISAPKGSRGTRSSSKICKNSGETDSSGWQNEAVAACRLGFWVESWGDRSNTTDYGESKGQETGKIHGKGQCR